MSAGAVIPRTLGLLSALGLVAGLAAPDLPGAITAVQDPQRVIDTRGADMLVLYLVQLTLLALCAWCALCIVLVAVSALHPSAVLHRTTARWTPGCGRRVLAAALGLGTLTLAACGTPSGTTATMTPSTTPAYAASSDAFDWGLSATQPGAVHSDGTTADGQGPAAPVPVTPVPEPAQQPPAAQLVVAPGDCLWSLATDHLGAGATTADVAYFVDALYLANRQLIGDDPDVLPAGVALALPAP